MKRERGNKQAASEIDFLEDSFYNDVFIEFPSSILLEAPERASLLDLKGELSKIKVEIFKLNQKIERLKLPAVEQIGFDEFRESLRALQDIVGRELPGIRSSFEERLCLELLPVLDSFDRFFEFAKESGASLQGRVLEGISAIRDQMTSVLRRTGLEELPVPELFDTGIHRAVGTVQAPDRVNGSVVKLYLKGYLHRGRTLRPAEVSIVKNN